MHEGFRHIRIAFTAEVFKQLAAWFTWLRRVVVVCRDGLHKGAERYDEKRNKEMWLG